MIDCFLGYPFEVLSCSFWTTVLHCCAWLQVHLNLQYHVVSCANFLTGGVFDVTLHIIDVWLYYVCYTRSFVTQCILFMVLYLYHIYQCRLQCVLCSHIGIVLMHLLTVEPCSITGLLSPSWCFCVRILLIPYSMAWDWLVLRAGSMLFF